MEISEIGAIVEEPQVGEGQKGVDDVARKGEVESEGVALDGEQHLLHVARHDVCDEEARAPPHQRLRSRLAAVGVSRHLRRCGVLSILSHLSLFHSRLGLFLFGDQTTIFLHECRQLERRHVAPPSEHQQQLNPPPARALPGDTEVGYYLNSFVLLGQARWRGFWSPPCGSPDEVVVGEELFVS